MNLFFKSDIVSLVTLILRMPNFIIFIVRSALNVGGRLKSHLLCSWFFSRITDAGSPRFHVFVSDVNQRNEETEWNQDLLA